MLPAGKRATTFGRICVAAAIVIATFAGWMVGEVLSADEDRQDRTRTIDPLTTSEASKRMQEAWGTEDAVPRGSTKGITAISPISSTQGLRSWMVEWRRVPREVVPYWQEYRLLDSTSGVGSHTYKIQEGPEGSRRVFVADSGGVHSRYKGPDGDRTVVSIQLVDTTRSTVTSAAMLVDQRGVPWGPVDSRPMALPLRWRGYVLARGYASAPLYIHAPGMMRVTMHPEATLAVTITSQGLDLVGSRLLLRTYGCNVGPSPGRVVQLDGRSQVWLRGLQRGQSLNLELMSQLQRFDIVRKQVRLEKASNEVQLVARAFAQARLVTSDPGIAGRRLYVAPFFAKDPKPRTLDFRYPWRVIEWDGSGWPLARLRAGKLDFWIWTDEGRFGRLGPSRFLAGSKGIEFAVRLAPSATATLRVPTHPLLIGKQVQVVLLDASYLGHPENLIAIQRQMPGLRLKTWQVQPGQTLQMSGCWQRKSRVIVRSHEGASLWEGTVDLEKGSHAPLSIDFAIGGLLPRSQVRPTGGLPDWRVYSRESGEVVDMTAGDPASKGPLLLRAGTYEVRSRIQRGPTHDVRIVAGQITRF